MNVNTEEVDNVQDSPAWQKLWTIFQDALELEPAQRREYLTDACGADDDLHREVLELLAEHEGANILDTPPFLASVPPSESLQLSGSKPGDVLANRFELIRLIGQGGMARVHEAKDLDLGIRVALKILRGDIASNPQALERFYREVNLAIRITHPNVCRIYDLFHHGDFSFLTMQLLEGETLYERIQNSGRLNTSEALPIIEQLAEALTAAHHFGIIHRDLKPTNVMLIPHDSGTRAVLTDFGTAVAIADTRLTADGQFLGTPEYMAPEQVRGEDVSTATDVYALGLLMYEMVTGKQPFGGDTPFSVASSRLHSRVTSPRKTNPKLSRTWDKTIVRCLEKNPKDRIQTPAEVITALKGGPVSIRFATERRKKQIGACLAILLAAMVLIQLWRQATIGKDEARAETKRAEASKVLAIGLAIPNPDPGTKLAYAIASLEFADSPQARRYALQALSEGPIPQILESRLYTAIELSPDGKWIAAGRIDGGLDLLADDGTAPVSLLESFRPGNFVQWKPQFSPDSKFLIWTWRGDFRVVKVWSLPDKKLVRTFQLEGLTRCFVGGGKVYFITDTTGRAETPMIWGPSIVRIWNWDHNQPKLIGRLDLAGNDFDIDSGGQSIAYRKENSVYVRSLDESGIGQEKFVGNHNAKTSIVRLHPAGKQLVSVDENGELRLWSMAAGSTNPIRTISGLGQAAPWFDPKGRFLFAPLNGAIAQWDLQVEGAEPLLYRSPDEGASGVVDPKNRWLAVQAGSTLAFYPQTRSHPYVFRDYAKIVRFMPDGKSMIGSNDSIYMWNIHGENETAKRTLWTAGKNWGAAAIDVDSLGKQVLAATGDGIRLISVQDGKDFLLKGISPEITYIRVDQNNVSFSPDGQSAVGIGDGIEIWDLQSGKSRLLQESKGKFCASLKYSPDGTLFSGCDGAVYRWNLKDDSAEVLFRGKRWVSSIASSKNGRYLAATFCSAKTIFELRDSVSDLVLYDLKERKTSTISSHGNRVWSVAFDPGSTRLISGDLDGVVRVGPVTGDTPHMLLGEEVQINDVAVHPGGMWIASTNGETVRLWQMPREKPLDALPYKEFLQHIRAITNIRAVADNSSPNGYRIKYERFPGWKESFKTAEQHAGEQ